MEIILALDSYDDIFDDFDMQDYIERAISADFVNILNNRIKKINIKEKISIVLTVPKEKREKNTEEIIAKRLNTHFANMAMYWKDKEKEIDSFASRLVLLGAIFFIVGQILIRHFVPFFDEYLIIPAWMFSFYGLDKFINEKPKAGVKKQFYELISHAKMDFQSQDIYSK
ncbi:MAG: hypothetical protein NTY68_00400 [Candidatus Micrarchaeota archaeon]|nr:hypothetical protein [Candidatus Micrarchaeota archaeon]